MLITLLSICLIFVVEELYLAASKQTVVRSKVSHFQMAEALTEVANTYLPSTRVVVGAAAHYQLANQYQQALRGYKRALEDSPAEASYWYSWLETRVVLGDQMRADDQIVGVIEHIARIAPNEPDIRLSMARLGLRAWYVISPGARDAFRGHLDWMTQYNHKMLWSYAYRDRRTLLLCRIYFAKVGSSPLCKI